MIDIQPSHKMSISGAFKNTFQQNFKLNTKLPWLYSGSAVLESFYGESYSNDLDIFVAYSEPPGYPYNMNWCMELYKLLNIKSSDFTTQQTSYGGGGEQVFMVLTNVSADKKIDIIVCFLKEVSPTLVDLHKFMVNMFDIKICALAWDGFRLYYPPIELCSLLKKESLVFGIEDDVTFRRAMKYLERGFKLFNNNTGELLI